MRLTASNLVKAIGGLPTNQEYQYVYEKNSGRIVIHHVNLPEGPIEICRYDPTKGEMLNGQPIESISKEMLWRLANALSTGHPVNVDRVFAGSYNTRSVLEALIAHAPQFYSCYPGRIEQMGSTTRKKRGSKHLIYLPDEPHPNGVIGSKDVDIEISEITVSAVYSGIELTARVPEEGISIEQQRRHAQMQIALILIGRQLGLETWVAANDRSIEYEGQRLGEMKDVISDLNDVRILKAFPEAAKAGRLIDGIWFRDQTFIPAVIEIEHSTGVKSGLERMLGFYETARAFKDVRWVIVAPDDDRNKVIDHANKPHFLPLRTKFFPYSAVEELYSLCERRKLVGVSDAFLDCFMEDCVES